MTQAEAFKFCQSWLAAWSRNQPAMLIEYYADNAYYQDSAKAIGIHGKANLFFYFQKLDFGTFPRDLSNWYAVRAYKFF